MQGYILHTQRQKGEDLIVRVLTESKIKTLYRFYGARHSLVHIGHRIDFVQESNGIFLPKLRSVMHLGFGWERELERVYVWQRFIGLLDRHLRDIYEVERFYMEVLDEAARKLLKQNPMRVMIEAYSQILSKEGRKPSQASNNSECFLCGEALGEDIALARSFMVAHRRCARGLHTQMGKIKDFLSTGDSLRLSDEEVRSLYEVLLLGF